MGSSQGNDDDDKKETARQEAEINQTFAKLALRRRRQRSVIISALAAGGVFQLNGWQVQAHGNRSTLSASPIYRSFNPLNVSALNTSGINVSNIRVLADLGQVSEELRNFGKSHPGAVKSPEYRKMVEIKTTLAKQVNQRPPTGESFKLVRAGDTPAAVAIIEGAGRADQALGDYHWTLLDIANLGREHDTVGQFTALAKPAMDYTAKVLAGHKPGELSQEDRELRQQAAQLYHQIASFTVPNDGAASGDDLKLGREASDRALALRREVGTKREIMTAEWMAGNHARRAGDSKAAELHLHEAASLAVALDDKAALAWSYNYLAKALATSKPTEAKSFEQKALAAAEAGAGSDVTLDFLRTEMRLAMK
jgi:hypothetical protein